jgi:hypothetical protein
MSNSANIKFETGLARSDGTHEEILVIDENILPQKVSLAEFLQLELDVRTEYKRVDRDDEISFELRWEPIPRLRDRDVSEMRTTRQRSGSKGNLDKGKYPKAPSEEVDREEKKP